MSKDFMAEVSEDFEQCWHAAKLHIQSQVDGPLGWYKARPEPPFLEHMSVIIGNQLFFIRVEDVNMQLEIPGELEGLFLIADGCKGYACVMPMGKSEGDWVPAFGGWGLLDARTLEPVNPPDLASDEPIEMSDWELHDFAVKFVRDLIQEKGFEVMAWQTNPIVEPSLWFLLPDAKMWVVVRAVRYPGKKAEKPETLPSIRSYVKAKSAGV